MGDKTQAQGNLALDNIIGVVEQGNRLADDINLELDKQIEQLDRMEQTVKDTQSILKRANKMIRYFARQIYTDKIIMGLICCIVLAIIKQADLMYLMLLSKREVLLYNKNNETRIVYKKKKTFSDQRKNFFL